MICFHLRRWKPQEEYEASSVSGLTGLIAVAESQVEGDDPGFGPRNRLHGEGAAAAAIQQGEQRRDVRQPAAAASAESHVMKHTAASLHLLLSSRHRDGVEAGLTPLTWTSQVNTPALI